MGRTYSRTKKRGKVSVMKRLRDKREKLLKLCLSDEYAEENCHVTYYNKLSKTVDENVEKMNIKKEENEMDIEDFDSKKYMLDFPTTGDGDHIVNDIDVSCVKQEIDTSDMAESDDINCSLKSQSSNITNKNNEIVEKLKSTQNSITNCDDTTLNVSSIHSDANNDRIDKKSEEQPSEIIKKVDLKRVLDTPQENIIKTVNQPKICILCAGSDNSNSKSIAHFTKMILDFSGVDILSIDSPPIACNSCFKQLKMVDNFKKQILYTNTLIRNATITVKNTCGNDAGESTRKSGVWEETDEEDDDWFTFETTRETFSKTSSNKRSKTPMEKSNLNQTDVPETQEEQTKYLDKKPFLCTACGNQYATLDRLKIHSECVHEERKHLCDVCGSIFTNSKMLKNHFRTHSGEKPYPCTHCKKKFSLKWNLDQHRRLHSNSFPYKCKMCPASYRHNVTLKRHVVKSHTAVECAVSSEKTCVEKSDFIADVQNSTNEGLISDVNAKDQNDMDIQTSGFNNT